jgi:tetratricopeptide (TPR) repeat protein
MTLVVVFCWLLSGAPFSFAQTSETVASDAPSAFALGGAAFDAQRYDQAIAWFEKAVQLDEANSDYHLWLGRAYGHEAQRSAVWRQPSLALKVKAHFERAVELNPDNLAARADLQEYYEKAPVILGGGAEKAHQQAQEIAKRKARLE